ncbi:hypothetical protein [Aliiroseovarius sp. 2305UL8-7]|uniref:hypothetical protein n=1 Tax=Aliiroseovarius conchicola TaxID=3121637 RepID=UPI003528E975
MRISISGINGTFALGSPSFDPAAGGRLGGIDDIIIFWDPPDRNPSPVTMSIEFFEQGTTTPVSLGSAVGRITDIDSAFPTRPIGRVDRVTVRASDGGATVATSLTAESGTPTFTIAGNVATATTTSNDPSNNDANGTAIVTVSNAVDAITLIYDEALTSGQNPLPRSIGIFGGATITFIIAENDDFSATPIVGGVGGSTTSVFGNDTLSGSTPTSSNIVLTVLTPATPNNPGDLVPVLNATTGTVDVPAGTPAGTYTIDYQICETLNPTNCDTATVTVVVALTSIDAIDDTPTMVDGATGATIPNVVTNDTLGGVANPTIGTDVTVNETGTAQDGTTALGLDVTPAAGGISLNPANGEVTVDPGTTAGTYVYGTVALIG